MTLGACRLNTRFLKGVHRLRPVTNLSFPSWDSALVLEALCGSPFEPIELMKFLSFKTALLALTAAKKMGDSFKDVTNPNAVHLPKTIPTSNSSCSGLPLAQCVRAWRPHGHCLKVYL